VILDFFEARVSPGDDRYMPAVLEAIPETTQRKAVKPHVLYLTHRVPFPPDKGDRIRNYHMLRQLSARAEVDLIALADEPVPPVTYAALAKHCRRVEIVPVHGVLRKLRAAWSAATFRSLTEGAFHEPQVDDAANAMAATADYGAVLVSCSGLAPYLRRGALAKLPGFVDLVDVDSQKWFDFAAVQRGPKKWLYQFEGRRLRKLERNLPTWAEAVSIVSPAETRVYDSFAGEGSGVTAMNGVDLEYFAPVPLDCPVDLACVFVGALDYLPNVDAACWFADEVWPGIRERYPTAEFRIVGRKPAARVQSLHGKPGVVVVGQVPDVRPHVAAAAVTVVPMRLSRGLQNKVLEAMAMAKPVIAAPPALAALAVEPGRDLLQAEMVEEWHAGVSTLFDFPERRRDLSIAARRFVEEHHHWDRCLRPILDRIVPTDGL